MLNQITISNLITIEKLQLELTAGMIAITGESGVGKSILIDAIELALGARANGERVRPGQEKADICLTFDLTQAAEARDWLKSYDLDGNSHECLIRRTLYRDGRSRSYINNLPITLQPLREFSGLLMNIHGQHEHHALLKTEVQRTLLDRYAGHEDLVFKVKHLAEEWHHLDREITELRTRANDRTSLSQYLKFQLEELEALQLMPHEFEALDLEHKQLAHADELIKNLNQSITFIADHENQNAIHWINEAIRSLELVQKVDAKIILWVDTLKNTLIQLSDIEDELHRYLDSLSIDPEQLQKTEERLSTLFNLARKHKVDPHELFSFQQKLATELKELEQSNERIELLLAKMQRLEADYSALAEKLSKNRAQSAKKLDKQITEILQTLSLPHGKFHIHFEPLPKDEIPAYGLEKIIFEIQTNPDQPMQSLAKIASGGELSRISLAIHIATAKQQTIPTLIFDEIDVGVSGQTAETIGKLLRQLGKTFQVLCITHVPQVAALSHHHLKVEKMLRDKTTYTTINVLEAKEKVKEIARMLGGAQITQKTLAHAEEMLDGDF
jgi:DNA repair protein RecN (Recombination protein N)